MLNKIIAHLKYGQNLRFSRKGFVKFFLLRVHNGNLPQIYDYVRSFWTGVANRFNILRDPVVKISLVGIQVATVSFIFLIYILFIPVLYVYIFFKYVQN